MSDLADEVSRAILADAGVAGGAVADADKLDAAAHLALVAASARGEAAARRILHQSVAAARANGVSWARIGAELGMTRQAAQQRFGDSLRGDDLGADERWLGPVTAFDELAELELAGRAGWRTVEAAMLSHRMVRTATQWQHRRILWRPSLKAEESAGWQIGCRAFPWVYLVRDTGIPVEDGA